jgi:hypothetical protein
MSRSGQSGLCCTVESNCSGMFTRLTAVSIIRDHALDTCKPSCVTGTARPFFIPVVHKPLGTVGYVASLELSSRGGRPGPRGSVGAHLGREARPGAEKHVAASELSSRGGRVRSHGTRGSTGAHLGREARSGAEEHVTAPELSSREGRARRHRTRGSAGAHLGREARSEAEEHVTAPELNSARRRGPEPRATWQHQSSPQQGGEIRGHGTRGGSETHLCREVWSEGTAYVIICGCTSLFIILI